MTALTFEQNLPLDVRAIGALFEGEHDQKLVWPAAVWPFDPAQWFAALDPTAGHRSFFVAVQGTRAGHIALRVAPAESQADCLVSYVYLASAFRGQGHAHTMLAFVEGVATDHFQARTLGLVVRTYNPAARRCYERAGFIESSCEGTLVSMLKHLA